MALLSQFLFIPLNLEIFGVGSCKEHFSYVNICKMVIDLKKKNNSKMDF